MKAGGGKQKGSAFERVVCKHLSLWITHGAKEDVFWRSAMSGGRATVHARRGKSLAHQAGDITATAEEGHALTNLFFIECKAYARLDIHPFLFGHARGSLHTFWEKAAAEGRKHGRCPMLIAKQDLERPFVVVDERDMDTWGLKLFPQHERAEPIVYLPALNVSLYWLEQLFPLPKPKLRSKP